MFDALLTPCCVKATTSSLAPCAACFVLRVVSQRAKNWIPQKRIPTAIEELPCDRKEDMVNHTRRARVFRGCGAQGFHLHQMQHASRAVGIKQKTHEDERLSAHQFWERDWKHILDLQVYQGASCVEVDLVMSRSW